MGPLIIVTAFAAQAAAPAAKPPVAEAAGGPKVGELSYLDVEGGVGYSTNPLLSFGGDTGAALGRISLHAVHTRKTGRSTTVLSGFAQNVAYTNHYSAQQSLSVNARHDTAVSEQLRLFGDATASYDKGGQLDTRIIGVPDVPPPPGTPGGPPVLLPPGSDFLSVTGRTYRFAGHVGGQLAASARDHLTLSSGVERVVFRGGVQDNSYTTVPVQLGYDRQLNERTTIGARVTAQNTEYDGPASVRMVTPQLTGRFALGPRISLNAAVGASFVRIDDGISIHHSTGLSADANLCGSGERSEYCARASIDQQTATTAGPAKSETLGIDYSRRLDADSTLQFSLAANHYSSPVSVLAGRTFSHATYYRGAASYTRRISDRWFGGVNLAARKLSEAGPDPKTDVNASLFVRYRFGDVQ
jgi:hypothetical protein